MNNEKRAEEMSKFIFKKTRLGAIDSKEVAEALTSEGYHTPSEIEILFSDLKKEIHDKAVYTHRRGVDPYINLNTLDGILRNHLNKYREVKKEGAE